MITRDWLAQKIYERTNVFPHAHFVTHLFVIGALIIVLGIFLLGYLVVFAMTRPDTLDFTSREYTEFMQGQTVNPGASEVSSFE